jgi:hypothetical protein
MRRPEGPAGRVDAGSPAPAGKPGVAQAAAVVAVGAAALSLVAGLGTYLYIRFTQGDKRSPADGGPRDSPR